MSYGHVPHVWPWLRGQIGKPESVNSKMNPRPFYAVKMRSGMVMAFEWSAQEIAEAMQNKGVVGVIRCIEAEGSIPAEEEAKRLFAAGKFDPSLIARQERK